MVAGANVNSQDEFNANTPAHRAALRRDDAGNANLLPLQILLKAGANPKVVNKQGESLADLVESAEVLALIQ